jgi:hypothetical protein
MCVEFLTCLKSKYPEGSPAANERPWNRSTQAYCYWGIVVLEVFAARLIKIVERSVPSDVTGRHIGRGAGDPSRLLIFSSALSSRICYPGWADWVLARHIVSCYYRMNPLKIQYGMHSRWHELLQPLSTWRWKLPAAVTSWCTCSQTILAPSLKRNLSERILSLASVWTRHAKTTRTTRTTKTTKTTRTTRSRWLVISAKLWRSIKCNIATYSLMDNRQDVKKEVRRVTTLRS